MEAAAAFGNDNPLLRSPVPQNPMDFEYFEKLVNSEDEAKHQVRKDHKKACKCLRQAVEFLSRVHSFKQFIGFVVTS